MANARRKFLYSDDEDIFDVSIEEDEVSPVSPQPLLSMAATCLADLFCLEDEPSDYLSINPTQMSPRDQQVTTQFLIQQLDKYGEVHTEKDVEYTDIPIVDPVDGKRLQATLKFDYCIDYYRSDKHPDQDRFAVVGNTMVGEGGNCTVWKVKGRLKPSSSGTLFYRSDKDKPKEKKKVARYERHTTQFTSARAVITYNLAKANKKLGLKYPMWIAVGDDQLGVSVSLMNRLKDYDLQRVLDINKVYPTYLDDVLKVNFRWDLSDVFSLVDAGKLRFFMLDALRYCRAIAIAYKEQVFDLNIQHRDIKPENMMIDLEKGPIAEAITIVDYDHARAIGDKSGAKLCGSEGYFAPEMLENLNPTTSMSDIFSLGCVLAQWFGDDSVYINSIEGDILGYLQSLNRMQSMKFFEGTPAEMKELVGRMVERMPSRRPDIRRVIDDLDDIILKEELAVMSLKTPSLR